MENFTESKEEILLTDFIPGHFTERTENDVHYFLGLTDNNQWMRTEPIQLYKNDSITLILKETSPIVHNGVLFELTIIENNIITHGHAFNTNNVNTETYIAENDCTLIIGLLFQDHYKPMTVEDVQTDLQSFSCVINRYNNFKNNIDNYLDNLGILNIDSAINTKFQNIIYSDDQTISVNDFNYGGYVSLGESSRNEDGYLKFRHKDNNATYASSEIFYLNKNDVIGVKKFNYATIPNIFIKVVVVDKDGYIIRGELTKEKTIDEYVANGGEQAFIQILAYKRDEIDSLTTLQTYYEDDVNFSAYYKPYSINNEFNNVYNEIAEINNNNNNNETLIKTLSGLNIVRFDNAESVSNQFSYIDNTVTIKGSVTTRRYCDPFTFTCLISGNYELSGCPETDQNCLCYFQGTTKYNKNGNPQTYYLESGQTYIFRIICYAGCEFGDEGITFTPSIKYMNTFLQGTDKTVSIAGQAADAASVRTLINNLKTQQAAGGADTNSLEVAYLGNQTLGDCSLLQFSNGDNFLIDCMVVGEWQKLQEDLALRDCQHLEYFMISHYHSDHIGNFDNLCDAGFIDSNTTVILPPVHDHTYDASPYPDNNRTDWLLYLDRDTNIRAKVQELGCTILDPYELQEIDISGCRVIFWNCDHSWCYGTTSNYNDWSICCYVINNNVSLCFTGDLGPMGQRHVMSLHNMYKATLYKTCHHGWSNGLNSIYPPFINSVNPDICISENSQVHINNGYIDAGSSPIQSWCEMNGRSHYTTIHNNNAIDIHVDKFGWHFKAPYIRYIRGENHKNWKYINNDTEYAE